MKETLCLVEEKPFFKSLASPRSSLSYSFHLLAKANSFLKAVVDSFPLGSSVVCSKRTTRRRRATSNLIFMKFAGALRVIKWRTNCQNSFITPLREERISLFLPWLVNPSPGTYREHMCNLQTQKDIRQMPTLLVTVNSHKNLPICHSGK